MSYYDLTTNLFLQIALIIIMCRIVSFIGKKYFGQTEVVCEMLSGIILGPSVFGILFPELQHSIFPADPHLLVSGTTIPNASMTLLFALSQIGIVIYMFLTGLDFNLVMIKGKYKIVSITVIAGIVIPYAAGSILIMMLNKEGLIVDGVSLPVAMIYFGAAISITAFPVLVRIMDEKKIINSMLGKLSLASGSIQDAIAWCFVAFVLTIINHNVSIVLIMIFGTIAYVIFMILVGRFLCKVFSNHFHEDIIPCKETVIFILILLMLCSVTVDKIGLYSAFGAFIAGIVMPKGRFSNYLKVKFSDLTLYFLLPIFFTFTGLNTKIYLIDSSALWATTFIIIIVAMFSKLISCTLSAYIMGINWRESLAYGVLMNTRGLMELIILNIGLQHNIITAKLFSMMVLMTLITTFMTSPLLSVILQNKSHPGSK